MKRFGCLLIILIVVILPFAVSRLYWALKEAKPLEGIVVDKTVLKHPGQEHTSFFWFLNNEKYTHSNQALYDTRKDYYGFYPLPDRKYETKGLEQFSKSALDSIARAAEFLYLADCYGIYHNEWYDKKDLLVEHSPKIYGGMNEQDLQVTLKMRSQNKLILSEFVTIASPTPDTVRDTFEDNFDIEWNGWVGHYHYSLDTLENKEIPDWFTKAYNKQYKAGWPFKEAGIILFHENGRVAVLENGRHLDTALPTLTTPKHFADQVGVPAKIDWPYFFDIMIPKGRTETMASYKIHTNSRGDSLMASLGLPSEFPAVMRNMEYPNRFYYFAGDFADNPVSMGWSKFEKIEKLSRLFYSKADAKEGIRGHFYWSYYLPLTRHIFDEYYRDTRRDK